MWGFLAFGLWIFSGVWVMGHFLGVSYHLFDVEHIERVSQLVGRII